MVDNHNDLDHLLVDLESNDSNNLASVLRAIYDSDESDKFMSKLEQRVSHLDQEIEQMCSAHYKSFIDCIRELLQVRPNADGLKRETMEINGELMKSTEVIQRKAEELIKARRILVNSSDSIEMLKKCLFVLEEYSKFNDQLKERKYFPALKTLESLERDHLPTVGSYRFAQNLSKEIPKFRVIIKEATTNDLNDFLVGLLEESKTIGEIVFNRSAKQDNFIPGVESSALSGIDFSPVYRGLHIFTNLGFREQFEEYYREQRRQQSRLAFCPPSNMNTIEDYRKYFSCIIGFFVIEDHLMGTTKDFIRTDYLNGLWSSAIQSMSISLKQHAKSCSDASLMNSIEKLILDFAFTIRNYGYNTDGLSDISNAIKEQYNEILMNQWKSKFERIFRQDGDYSEVVRELDFFEAASQNFPKKFPFSLWIYRRLQEHIDEFLRLADYDWTRTEASGQASSFILDLIAWLRNTFQAFANLPEQIAQGACMSACKHIAQSLSEKLLSEDVKSLSIGALEQFNLDLIQCELFASSEPVKGFKEGDLQMVFAELRQLCDLFLYEDYSTYISDLGKQQNKYLRVTTAMALTVVDKLRECDKKKSVFSLKKNDKQKLRDTFAENLRGVLESQPHSRPRR